LVHQSALRQPKLHHGARESGRLRQPAPLTVQPRATELHHEAREVNVMTGSSRTAGNRNGSEWLTVEEVCAELKISPRTFYRWRAQGTGPRSKRIARGGVRVRRSWLDEWLDEPERGIA
jgi:excisionase family DNA binding protein